MSQRRRPLARLACAAFAAAALCRVLAQRRGARLGRAGRAPADHARHARRYPARLRDAGSVDPLNANLQVNLEKMARGGLDAAFFIVYVGADPAERREPAPSTSRRADEVRGDPPNGRRALSRAGSRSRIAPTTSSESRAAASSSQRSASRTATCSARASRCSTATTSSARATSRSCTTATTISRARRARSPSSATARSTPA